jgi:hypothetical protein
MPWMMAVSLPDPFHLWVMATGNLASPALPVHAAEAGTCAPLRVPAFL